jgi:hypothetical protein
MIIERAQCASSYAEPFNKEVNALAKKDASELSGATRAVFAEFSNLLPVHA